MTIVREEVNYEYGDDIHDGKAWITDRTKDMVMTNGKAWGRDGT